MIDIILFLIFLYIIYKLVLCGELVAQLCVAPVRLSCVEIVFVERGVSVDRE